MWIKFFKQHHGPKIVCLFFFALIALLPASTASANEFCDALEEEEFSIKPYQDVSLSKLQLEWPTVAGRSISRTSSFSMGEFLDYAFYFAVWLAVVFAFLSLLYIGLSYYRSGGSPEKSSALKQRFKSIFVGLLILVFATSILRFIDPDNQPRVEELEERATGIARNLDIYLPEDAGTGSKIRDVSDHPYFPIPFTNDYGAQREYYHLIQRQSLSGNTSQCATCGAPNPAFPACSFFCDEDQNLFYQGYDLLKSNLECQKVLQEDEVKSYAFVRDDDDPQVSCAAACLAIAEIKLNRDDNNNTSSQLCKGVAGSDDKNENFLKWLDDNLDDYIKNARKPAQGSLYENFYVFGRSNSMSDGDLREGTTDLRKCIADFYVYDAQQFPLIEGGSSSLDICLCRR